jgi:hypothetical protein
MQPQHRKQRALRDFMQTYVGALEAQLTSKHRSDSASLDAVAALQRRDEECFELHRKLEVGSYPSRAICKVSYFEQIQQQQLEDMALENKLLLQVHPTPRRVFFFWQCNPPTPAAGSFP